ncbi:MAG TPA: hypothetical protein VHG08_28110 [Longimicrobium sp.]|nr:hypothetical protein [Longimicrobium sp.]
MIVRSLLEDGLLRVEVHPRLLSALARWLPLVPPDTPAAPGGAAIRIFPVDDGVPAPARPDGPRTLRLGVVDAWIESDRALLLGPSGMHGLVRLAEGAAELRAPADGAEPDAVAWDLYSACTVSCALLLGRLGRALVHAAAVAPPGAPAWLLVGDTHAGKTTTSANLLRAGWSYLSDDHVVLGRDADGGITVEGLPRPFHLDEGWEAGEVVRRRGSTDPRARWPGRWRRTAPLAGLLFPRVEADAPTALGPFAAADALAALLRQSPWLLADRGCAPAVLDLLRATALLPTHALRLGRDTYADPARLAGVMGRLGDAAGAAS